MTTIKVSTFSREKNGGREFLKNDHSIRRGRGTFKLKKKKSKPDSRRKEGIIGEKESK